MTGDDETTPVTPIGAPYDDDAPRAPVLVPPVSVDPTYDVYGKDQLRFQGPTGTKIIYVILP